MSTAHSIILNTLYVLKMKTNERQSKNAIVCVLRIDNLSVINSCAFLIGRGPHPGCIMGMR